MVHHDDLLDRLAQALEPAEATPPTANLERLRAEARRRQPAQQQRPRPWAVVAAVAALVAVFILGTFLPFRRGVVEFDGALLAVGGAEGSLTVRRLGIGRTVEISTDALPILPTSEFYEVWFVGPEDRPDSPQRISAGTFHPDEYGRSRITLTAAVDPAKFPVLSITAEPGDGNPAATGPEVMRADLIGGS